MPGARFFVAKTVCTLVVEWLTKSGFRYSVTLGSALGVSVVILGLVFASKFRGLAIKRSPV